MHKPRLLLLAGMAFSLGALGAASACRGGDTSQKTLAAAPPAPVPAAAPEPTAPGEDERGVKVAGGGRFRDTGVYVDGQPVGVLSFGELPITLAPVWLEQKASAPKRPHSNDPGYRLVRQRYYRFTDYLTAVGVDLRRVKELHIYGPHPSEAIVVSGAELRARGKDFLFHFGGDVWGKPIPLSPPHFGNGKSPDKITGMMVYIDKPPPRLVWNQGMELDGQVVTDIPYYGEPMRGGIRVYLDDRLATTIKRRLLDDSKYGVMGKDGQVRWKLFGFLEAQGVDTAKISEAWVVRDERRREKLTRAQLVDATFESSPAARGQILIGDAHVPANALALHTRPVRDSQLPRIQPEEDEAQEEAEAAAK